MTESWKKRVLAPKVKISKDGPPGWYSRGYLPHFDGGEIPQTITFNLFDSLPERVLKQWYAELTLQPDRGREVELRKRIDAYLDKGVGSAWMNDPAVADLVQNALLAFDRQRYRMHAWVVMPNHVHALFTPIGGWELSDIFHSWKSYTAHECNRILGRTGRFWRRDCWDRYIRDDQHYANVVRYIEYNPVKVGLCKSPEDWRWSSAHLRSQALLETRSTVTTR